MRNRKRKSRNTNKRKKCCKRSTNKKRRKQRGGFTNVPLTPANFLPPNGGVQVPFPGVTCLATKGVDQQYYYAKNNRVMGNPDTTNRAMRGGRRKKRRTKRRTKRRGKRRGTKRGKRAKKCCTKRRKRCAKRGKRHQHKGGGLSALMESIPGGTDLRDVYYKAGNMVGSAWSQYNGYGGTNEPPMSNYTTSQPIANNNNVSDNSTQMGDILMTSSKQAAMSPYTAEY